MAENKNKIIVYKDWISTFESLTEEEAGRLIKHLFRYINDLNPKSPDRLTALLFEPIKQTLKRDLKKWESEIEKQSYAGKLGNLKRYNPDLYKLIIVNEITIEEAEKIAFSRKESHPDSPPTKNVAFVAVSVNDSDSDNDIVKEEKEKTFNFKKSLIDLGIDKKIVSDWLTVRRKKKGANTETAFNAIKKQIDLSGAAPEDCIKKAVEKSWCGFEAEWYFNSSNNGRNTGKQTGATIAELATIVSKEFGAKE